MQALTEKGWYARGRTGRRGCLIVAGGGLLVDGAGGLAVRTAALAFEDRRLAGVLKGAGRRVVELYPMLKAQTGGPRQPIGLTLDERTICNRDGNTRGNTPLAAD